VNLTLLVDDIRKSLEKQSKEEYDNGYNDKIMKELLKDSIIKYPPQMLDREIELFIEQLENRLAQQKMDMDTYLKMRKIDAAALRSEITPQAEERLKRTLILLEIAKAENIHVENSELESESKRTLDELGRMMPSDKARKTLTNEFVRGMIGNIGADLLVKHTWDYLQSVAHGEKDDQQKDAKAEETVDIVKESPVVEPTKKPKNKRTIKKVEKNEPK
jgi:trigger factor